LTEHVKGTTTVGIVCKDGVVLAADRRGSYGDMIMTKNATKLFKIDEHLALAGAGSVGDILSLVRHLQVEATLYKMKTYRPMSVRALATLTANILQGSKYMPYFAWFLIGGYDEKPKMYSIDPVGGITEDRYVAAGSGMEFAYAILEDSYKENITLKRGIKLAVRAVNSALKRDVYTGDGIMLVAVDKKGYREVSKEEIEEILKKL